MGAIHHIFLSVFYTMGRYKHIKIVNEFYVCIRPGIKSIRTQRYKYFGKFFITFKDSYGAYG